MVHLDEVFVLKDGIRVRKTIELNDLLQSFEQWISFTRSMHDLHEDVWNSSIEEGKWTIRDIIIHIALWDKYFYEEAIEKIVAGQPLTLIHLDYDEFNSMSIQYGRTITTDELIEQAISYRKRIIDSIRTLSTQATDQNYTDADGNVFYIPQYLKDFIWHDQHHIVPLKEYLSTRRTKSI